MENFSHLVNLSIESEINQSEEINKVKQAITNLINVELVYMDNNQLSGVIPNRIGSLENVAILHLNNNQLSSLPENKENQP